ncbi:uncharacterized protein PHACADRAFT_254278 [Phanerochaete carnosa HHB-10118-sp]|uniref:Zn(2)-C6 fungal-type domain-containing protein n=1 Tax=Phanerochaete carnosa (strain HHB-10118-sp) TaxID=650164 RepID=K5V2X7_PHACS|nr:uncharacterized protein PHACADRAFT_254278 [Phanerochaete carnosa HHB-10118-sp]EKM56901.1 hypothetical protein PHACADRAFT_254278 [Phanerochaete carnosa HHB-10118-sp]
MFDPASPEDLAAAAAIFKNPVPVHGPKRNTACQQCRKRKLQCTSDSQRPCSTCVRSLAHARAHAVEGVPLPDEPDCTYGDDREKDQLQASSKVERLENRISELETLLSQMQLALEASHASSPASSCPSYTSPAAGPSPQQISPITTFTPPRTNRTYTYYDSLPAQQDNSGLGIMNTGYTDPTSSSSMPNVDQNAVIPISNSRKAQLLAMGWPEHLPDPMITKHLVHAFFAFNMYAGRLFHGPTFLASLDLHPNNSRFPFSAILHAMCAVGSLYTADIPQPPTQSRSQYTQSGQFFAVDELFSGRWRQFERRPDSFAEVQAKLARFAGEAAINRGERLVECLQIKSYIASGRSIRSVAPYGFTMAAPFHVTTQALTANAERPPSILPNPQTVVEAEMRRNIFWIAYAMERQQACGNSFAMMLDDLDVCQLLPVCGDSYEQGTQVSMRERQWSHDKRMFLSHAPNQTDSFVLFIKTTILLSHVKNFNLRYRGRYYQGDPSMYAPNPVIESPATYDPRSSPAFKELDSLIAAFRPAFPSHLKNPVQDEMVDAYLYAANCGAQLAQILLHEPHVHMSSPRDPSTHKLINAARGILELMYAISATSYDISLLDHLPILSWNCCGRVLIKALRVANETKNYEQAMVLQSEIAYVHSMLAKAGERMPLAYRYKKMVYAFLANHCGPQFVESLPQTSYHARFPSPPEGFYPTSSAQVSNVNIYSPGTYAAVDPGILPMGQQMQGATHSHVYHPHQV